jgi:hypothetical protein
MSDSEKHTSLLRQDRNDVLTFYSTFPNVIMAFLVNMKTSLEYPIVNKHASLLCPDIH